MKFEICGYSKIKIQNNIFYDQSHDTIVDRNNNQHRDFKICKVAKTIDGYEYHSGDIKNFSVFKYEDMVKCEFPSINDYNIWRNTLAKLLQYNPSNSKKYKKTSYIVGAFDYDSGPFLNLICFVDCDGYINHSLCYEIYADFEKYTNYMQSMPESNFIMDKEDFLNKYIQLKLCFQAGMDNGLVQL